MSIQRKDIYKEAYEEALNDPALRGAQEEFKPKTFRKKWKWALVIGVVFQVLFQVVSGATAFTAIAWVPFFFTGYWSPGIIVAALFLPLLEWGKHKDWSLFWREWFLFEKGTNWPALFIGLSLLVISLAASLLGTPILVEHITPAPTLVDTEGMKEKLKVEKDSISNFWDNKSQDIKAQAATISAANSWKGTLTKTARPIVLEHNNRALSFVDSSTLQAAKHESNGIIQIKKAQADNEETIEAHIAKGLYVGNWAMLGTFLLELLTILIVMGRKYYWFRAITEAQRFGGLQSQDQSEEDPIKDQGKNESLGGKPDKNELSNSESFKSEFEEGSLHKINGVWNIGFVKDNGEVKFYPKNILSTRISQTKNTNKETFNRLVDLKEKLSSHITKETNGRN